jgi:hypothetical protein
LGGVVDLGSSPADDLAEADPPKDIPYQSGLALARHLEVRYPLRQREKVGLRDPDLTAERLSFDIDRVELNEPLNRQSTLL